MVTQLEQQQRLERLLRGQQDFMDEVHAVLADEQKKDDVIRAVVRSSRGVVSSSLHRVDPDRVFSGSAIRAMCIKYRLRFLDSGLFQGELPMQAIHAIRRMEEEARGPVLGYKVMAPAVRFRLCDSEADPLLFVPIGEDCYYLVHKWGQDMSAWRAWLGWPVRSPLHLACTVVLCALVLTVLVPGYLIGASAPTSYFSAPRAFFLVWSTMVLGSFTVFGWFAFFGRFSTESWNSRYFN